MKSSALYLGLSAQATEMKATLVGTGLAMTNCGWKKTYEDHTPDTDDFLRRGSGGTNTWCRAQQRTPGLASTRSPTSCGTGADGSRAFPGRRRYVLLCPGRAPLVGIWPGF